ncbi:Cytochrome c553 [Roseovarius litoreus]|jgi:mono/diheme cytochrome c family protein|uniref:Cytochrome c553 n=1 Tax=Roseovarius litoreus TaxID=1155722 RepID=A0A1M7FA61_9RHOB|nr:c-type cytochrome [Roseovarius litoreus]SHM00880.1 Cytochrome c553 [Roseovarius litoreus]
MQTPTLITAALALVAALTGAAQAEGNARNGEAIYERYCAACHGADATGDGPMQAVLTVQPTDLTALSAGNDGVFPMGRVVKRIDGRDPLVAHGSPMPIYGDFFQGQDAALKTESGQPIITSTPVTDLIAYLEGLQIR